MMAARTPEHDAESSDIPPTIPAALGRAARLWPGREALIDGTWRLSFREYRELSLRMARGR